jgi:pyrimidine operon attenuation protein/uracil phosphoribosyltransferase
MAKTSLLDAEGMARALKRMAAEIARSIPPGAELAVIGIRRRGDVLARRLSRLLSSMGVAPSAHGALDITLYRDDLAEKGGTAEVRATQIDFDITGRYLVLVDDVLHTGRTVRAALDALADLGRPQAIRLGVLVERRGRELPIQADFVGLSVEEGSQHVKVNLQEVDDCDGVEGR